MKKLILILTVCISLLFLISCEKNDIEPRTCFYCESTRTEMENNEWIPKLISQYSFCDFTESEILELMRENTYMDNYNHYKYEMTCIKIMDDTYIK